MLKLIIQKNIINRLHFYCFNNSDFERFPIIDTKSNLEYTIQLLNKYYDEGYRIFLGFSRSTVLNGVLIWFNNHPDAIGISMFSTAPSLKIKKNIFRMEYSDDLILEVIEPYLKKAEIVYYIYSVTFKYLFKYTFIFLILSCSNLCPVSVIAFEIIL